MIYTYEGATLKFKGRGTSLPPEAMGPYICEALGVTPLELAELDYETVQLHLAWAEGKSLARAASEASSS